MRILGFLLTLLFSATVLSCQKACSDGSKADHICGCSIVDFKSRISWTSFSGTVIDRTTSKPVDNCKVTCYQGRDGECEWISQTIVYTNDSGQFSFDKVAEGDIPTTIWLEAEGYTKATASGIPSTDSGPLTLDPR